MDVNKTKCYSDFKYIGEGGFSVVYKALFTPLEDDENMYQEEMIVAVKKIKMKVRKPRLSERIIRSISKKVNKRGGSKGNALNFGDVKNELDICEALSENNFILNLLDSLFVSKDEFWLVFEFTLGDLHHIVVESKLLPQNRKKQRYLPIQLTRHLIAPIISALSFMHDAGFIHLDVKEDNILLSEWGVPKLSDFGAAKEYIDLPMKYTKKGPGGTFYYMSPEILRFEDYTTSTDTWGLGVTLISLVYGGRPFELQANFTLTKLHEFLTRKCIEQDEAHKQNNKRMSAQDRFYRLASLNTKPIKALQDVEFDAFARFVKTLMILDPNERPTLKEACNDPYVSGVIENWQSVGADVNQELKLDSNVNAESTVFVGDCKKIVKLLCSQTTTKKSKGLI